METWENTILKWVNCLYDSSNCIKNIEELQDGKIYYNLVNKVIPWSIKSNKNQRDMILYFLKDEYPNFPFKNDNSKISKLCVATLVLSRLSFESTFHKMMCANLDYDVQEKIKSVLETVFSLDKNITEEDLYNIFALASKNNLKLFDPKPTFMMDEFIETPVPTDDNIQEEHNKKIRQLQIQIESLKYENSDLVADIAAQDSRIKDLQNQLQEALSELKMVREDNFQLNQYLMEPKDKKAEKSISQMEENLKKYIFKLVAENKQIEDKKTALANEVKQLYTEQYKILKEKNENKKKVIELSVLNKSQERQIKDLQNKLGKALTAQKSLELNNSSFTKEAKYKNPLETAGFSKLKGLEKSIIKLKTRNYQLEQEKQALVQEKHALIDSLKFYKEKHILKTKFSKKNIPFSK